MLHHSKIFSNHSDYENYIQNITINDKPNISICKNVRDIHYLPLTIYTFRTNLTGFFDDDGPLEGRIVKIAEGKEYIFRTYNQSEYQVLTCKMSIDGVVVFSGKSNSFAKIEQVSGSDVITHYKITIYSVTGNIIFYS